MKPGCTKSEAKIEKNALNRPKWLPDGSQDPFNQMWGTILTHFWLPRGTPKSTQNGVLGENGGSIAVIFSIFAQKGAATHFFIDFSSIFDQKIDVFFVVFFQPSWLFLGHGDLHDSMVFSNRNPLFHFSIF